MRRESSDRFETDARRKILVNSPSFSRALRRGRAVALAQLRWTRSSYLLLSVFLATLFVIGVVWWPLVADYLATADPARPL